MEQQPTLQDLIGIEYAKLGFFREVQEKIAELHASNLELMRKKHHIQAILNGITDVMAVITLDLRIASVNHVFHDMFQEKEPRGKFCYQVFRRESHSCSQCPVLTAAASNRVCRQLVIYPVNGKNRHFEITASPLRNTQGDPCHILLLKRDVTLEKEFQAKFYQAEKMATVGVLAAGVAHEINNPLTAISGFAEGLRRRLPRVRERLDSDLVEDFNEYINTIMKECQRCQEIVQSLLTFSRQAPAAFCAVNLNALVSDTLKLLHSHLKHHRPGSIQLKFEENLPPARGDASQLKQVILNLLLNALDAIKGKGEITIRTFSQNPDWVMLAVEDTGCGVSPDHLNKLFEPFFTTKPVGQGIGVGLSTCYNIVHSHGGEITVCSEERVGSTFVVRLPRD